ncbi:MAG: F0F1 ATP synthase subunit A [Defluviitaleaceae bacterium]|nr:F0F1 ATP synthase subunit A [Defluviitaleaceae bacterium]
MDNNLDFNIQTYHRIYLTDELWISINDTLISTWIIGGILIIFAIIARIKIKNFKPVPETRFQNIIEAMVEGFDNFVAGVMTRKYAFLGNWFFGVFMFLVFANISGIFGLRPPTADFATTYPIALTTVILMQYMGIRYNMKKGEYVREFFRPVFLFAPLNVISEFSRSISLSLRLFGNMAGGLIVMGLIYGLFPWFLSIGIPGGLSIYFDIIVGALHAFMFVVLSMYFIMMKVPQED